MEAANPPNNSTPVQVHHSSDFGWKANQDVTGPFAKLLDSGKLKAGQELVLDHRYRISGSHMLPDNVTLSAVKKAGFDVTDAAKPRNNRPLLELGNNNTLRNLTITYLDTPRPGPTGEERGVTFTSRLGIQARGKHDLMLRNCRLVGSIGHHLKLTDCDEVKVIGCHIAGGHWSTYLVGNVTDTVFRHCLIEKCQGDGIKTGGSIRYRSIRLSGERIKPVQISSIGGSRHLSEEAAQALEHTVTGDIVDEPAPPIKPGITEVLFAYGPQALE